MKKVILYSYEACPHCRKTKALLKEHNIDYTNFDVLEDPDKAQEMMKLTQQGGVPVLIVRDGETENIVIGFDEPKIKEALGLK
jgi:glutaredoxin